MKANKATALFALLAIVSMLLGSCAPAAAPPTAAPEVPAAPGATAAPAAAGEWTLAAAAAPWKGETLRLIGEALPPLEALQDLKSEFEEATGVEVVIEGLGHDEAVEKVTLDFAGQTGVYDLVLQPHRTLGKFVQNGWLRPIDEFYNDPALRDPNFSYEDDILNQTWFRETCTYQGKTYGLPFHFISMYLWYRIDLFENPEEQAAFKAKYGYDLPSPPVTWDQYRDTSEFFTRKAGEKLAGKVLETDFYGHSWGFARHVGTWYDFLNILYSFGGRDVALPDNRGDSYGPVVVNSPEAVEALQYLIDMIPYAPPGVLNYSWDEKQAAHMTGITAQSIQWDDSTFSVEDPTQSSVVGLTGYSGVPIGREKVTQVEGWSYFIPTSSKKPELAWLFLQWAMGKGVQVAQMKLGGESGLRSTYDDLEVASISYVPTAVYLKTEGQLVLSVREPGSPSSVGVPRAYLEAINPATGDTSVTLVSKPIYPEEEQTTEAIFTYVNMAAHGQLTAKEALDQLAAEMKAILPK